jgi:hypothetical protein
MNGSGIEGKEESEVREGSRLMIFIATDVTMLAFDAQFCCVVLCCISSLHFLQRYLSFVFYNLHLLSTKQEDISL